MVDLDFERKMNPWLFDSNGNLTDQAKKQFPDLADTPTPVNFPVAPAAPAGGGGGALTVQPAALHQASAAATALQGTVHTECTQPWTNVGTAVGSLNGWATGGALSTAWTVWAQQVQSLSDRLGTVSSNLAANATNYTTTDANNHRRLQAN
jgi:uncharacterized protein YukE